MWRPPRFLLLSVTVLLAACGGGISFNDPYTPDTQPPTAPSNLQAFAGSGSVSLLWDASSDNVGVEAYSITRQTSPVTTPAYFVSATNSFTDTSVASGVTYCYSVTAVDYQHNVSAPSNTACATVP